ncbi:MAG: hypothetical protein R3D62_14595 [Xanthobacteraceae bacterium]
MLIYRAVMAGLVPQMSGSAELHLSPWGRGRISKLEGPPMFLLKPGDTVVISERWF